MAAAAAALVAAANNLLLPKARRVTGPGPLDLVGSTPTIKRRTTGGPTGLRAGAG